MYLARSVLRHVRKVFNHADLTAGYLIANRGSLASGADLIVDKNPDSVKMGHNQVTVRGIRPLSGD